MMTTQENMMRRTADSLCRLLKRYGIEAKADDKVARIEDTLRMTWYVPKMKEMGYRECIYVNMPKEVGGFFIVTDTCELVTASNIMIMDAVQCVLLEVGYDDDANGCFHRFKYRGLPEFEGSETGILALQVTQLERAMRYMALNTMYKGMPEFEMYFDHKKIDYAN